MKVNEVPQDNAFLQSDNQIGLRDRYYALDEDGKFQEVPSVGWKPKNAAIQFAWNNRAEEAESSPTGYNGQIQPLAPYGTAAYQFQYPNIRIVTV